jgi:pimeloyl-ACP methyl ester carboxylesterase
MDVDLLLPANDPAMFAVVIRFLASARRLPFDGRVFSTGSLATFPYTIRWVSDCWQTSLGESFTLDPDGWLERLDAPSVQVMLETAPPPRWRSLSPRGGRQRPARTPSGCTARDVRQIAEEVTLWGRFTRPRDRRAIYGGVLIVGGSGAHDRFGFAGAIDLGYGDIARGLARRGFACLQYDKPGAGRTRFRTTTNVPKFDGEVWLARRWADWLRRRFSLTQPLFLLGHSQGGQVALVLTREGLEVDGICLLATAGRPLDAVLAQQLRIQGRDLQIHDRDVEARLHSLRRYFDWIRADEAATEVPVEFAHWAHLRSWYRGLLATSPERTLPTVRAPVLIVQGAADIQVAVEDSARLETIARESGVTVTRLVFSGLDHLFKPAGAENNIARYADRRRRVSPMVIAAIAEWLRATVSLVNQEAEGNYERRQ